MPYIYIIFFSMRYKEFVLIARLESELIFSFRLFVLFLHLTLKSCTGQSHIDLFFFSNLQKSKFLILSVLCLEASLWSLSCQGLFAINIVLLEFSLSTRQVTQCHMSVSEVWRSDGFRLFYSMIG